MVQSIFYRIRLLAHILLFLPFAHGGGFLEQTFFLLGFSFWAVFVEEFEGLGGGVAVEVIGELGDGGGDFEAEVEDFLLAFWIGQLGYGASFDW